MPNPFEACKDCKDRTEFGACHSTCEKYLKAVEKKRRDEDTRKSAYRVAAYDFERAVRNKKRNS